MAATLSIFITSILDNLIHRTTTAPRDTIQFVTQLERLFFKAFSTVYERDRQGRNSHPDAVQGHSRHLILTATDKQNGPVSSHTQARTDEGHFRPNGNEKHP